ncbi:MAG: branched chain amino acid aminotransferase [Candidatus Solibacter sp.]|nr:branched chain amino acid aminotransferase [Candidatus Solibacter sp.]
MKAADPNPDITVYFNGRYMRLGDANVNILTHALHYGTGVFEGIRAYWSAEQHEMYLFRAEEHYSRWKSNCGIIRIKVGETARELCGITAELCRRNGFHENVYVRPLAFKSAPRVGVQPDDRDSMAIIAIPFGVYLDSEKGLHAGVVSWRRVEDNAIPGRAKICGAYVNSALAGDEARRNGFDEAIFLTESGHVAEGATCNIFMVRKGQLVTPPPSDNILEGLTRDSVMQLARREMRLEVVERSIDRSEMYVCDELFFTGTAVEVGPITQVDHRPVGDGTIGKTTARLRQLYADAVRGGMDSYQHWLLPAGMGVAAPA